VQYDIYIYVIRRLKVKYDFKGIVPGDLMIAEIFPVIDLLLQKPEIEFCVVFCIPQTIC
jgi:hypothetical protein